MRTKANTDQSSVLFLTNKEHGQSNVVLAVMYELLLSGEVDHIHVASFESFRGRVSEMQQLAINAKLKPEGGRKTSVTFHALPGLSMHEQMKFAQNPPSHRPGFRGAIAQYNRMTQGMGSWNAEVYLGIYGACRDILETVNAGVIVVGHLFSPGMDACNILGIRYFYISSDMFREHRPSTDSLWYTLCQRPAMCSGYPTPIPWYLVIPNVLLYLILAFNIFVQSTFFRRILVARRVAGIPGPFPLFIPCVPKITYLVPSAPEIDFPLPGQSPPENVICCGPILLPSNAANSSSEADLLKWVSSAPTIVICFGSALAPGETYNTIVATALLKVLVVAHHTQVLWKLDVSLPSAEGVTQIMGSLLKAGRVRFEKWIPLVAALQTDSVSCLVHHGGTNIFLEALSHAVPQVTLPCYFLTYERANLTEYLGVGIYGSKNSQTAPACDSDELANSILRVIFDASFGVRAKRMAEIASTYGGRRTAATHILQAINSREQVRGLD